ncbi:transcriptional repressor NrdR [Candidatus Dojkabacteria bacterium]|uniref:Transcriptional repressor NrdR n=1 Tax=Candidatus Dojkabacteria bacterium TaxID=2099670 RepID=A0A3M0Z085_9BACT|nr:MAG: transcriptional repressor NrdR [Candidatus Dojkabacteria bacterium]
MNCPYCSSTQHEVIDKRSSTVNSIRRRRECKSCGKRFTTYERIEKVTLQVLKRDGRVEDFDREKLKRGILKAVKKRNISENRIDELINEIEQNLLNTDKTIIKSVDIGEMVLAKLTEIDKLGALLFASVYKEFQTLEEVEKELKRLSNRNKKT